jgi:predicted ester cyclase
MSEQNKAVIRRMITEHWNAKNHAIVGEFYAPTASLKTPDGALNGLDGASALLEAYATGFPDFRLTIDDLVAEDEKIVVRFTFTGTQRGPLADIRATGRAVNLPNVIHIFRLSAGKVVEAHMCWDRYALRQQLGVLPASS